MEKEIKKTCVNCIYYHSILEDTEDKHYYHIHNYCALWKHTIPDNVIFNREGYSMGYDDIECGLACCWGFYPVAPEKCQTQFYDMSENSKNEDW